MEKNMISIPSDVWLHIFDFFDAKMLVQFAMTNRAMYNQAMQFLSAFHSLRTYTNDHFTNFDLYHYHIILRDNLMPEIYNQQQKQLLNVPEYVESHGLKMVAYVLCQQIPHAHEWNEKVFFLLAKIGHVDLMEEMLKATTQRVWNQHCPIYALLHRDNTLTISQQNICLMVDLMIQHGLKPSNKHTTALFYAIPLRNENLVLLLLENGCTRINGMVPPLHYAARKGSPAIMRLMLQFIPTPNELDGNGRTAMHFAAQFVGFNCNEKMEIMTILKEHGCDHQIADANGRTAIDVFYQCIQNDENVKRNEYCIRFIRKFAR